MSDEKLNGATTEQAFDLAVLRTWALVYTSHECGFVGHVAQEYRLHDNVECLPDTVILERSYPFIGGYALPQNERGQILSINRLLLLAPDEFFEKPIRRAVRPVSMIRMSDLDEANFEFMGLKLLQGMKIAENVRAADRAARSGLVMANAGTKLPPLPKVK